MIAKRSMRLVLIVSLLASGGTRGFPRAKKERAPSWEGALFGFRCLRYLCAVTSSAWNNPLPKAKRVFSRCGRTSSRWRAAYGHSRRCVKTTDPRRSIIGVVGTDVVVWEGDLAAGTLPPICVITGQATSGSRTVHFATTPGWVFVLLLFGFFPFLIAWILARRAVRGLLPLSPAASSWLTRRNTVGLAVSILIPAACFLVAGASALIGASDLSTVLVIAGLIAAVVVLLASLFWYWPNPIRAFVGESTPWGRWITLRDVDPTFADAVKRMYALRATPIPAPPPLLTAPSL